MIAVRDLRFRYRRSSVELFDGLVHEFRAGTLTAITGRSGRGKSTLLYILGLLLRPTSGSVRFDGTDVTGAPDRHRSVLRATRLGFVFQDAALDQTRTVLDNVTEVAVYAGVPRRGARERARALLEQFDVQLREDHRPGEVSGGQAQRVALCRALLTRPDVILADEPTGNLDDVTSGVVLDALAEHAAAGAAVVVASHDRGVVERCEHVVAL